MELQFINKQSEIIERNQSAMRDDFELESGKF